MPKDLESSVCDDDGDVYDQICVHFQVLREGYGLEGLGEVYVPVALDLSSRQYPHQCRLFPYLRRDRGLGWEKDWEKDLEKGWEMGRVLEKDLGLEKDLELAVLDWDWDLGLGQDLERVQVKVQEMVRVWVLHLPNLNSK